MEHDIIFDLLPLYHDGVCSAASRAAVEAHLKACGTCREALLEMDAPLPAAEEQKNAANGAVVKGISEAWKKEKWKARLKGAAIAAAVCLLLVGAWLAATQLYIFPVPAEKIQITNVRQLSDGRVLYHFYIDDGLNLRRIKFEYDEAGNKYYVPVRSLITEKRWDGVTSADREMALDVAEENAWAESQGIDREVTRVWYGRGEDAILLWEEGMDLPAAGEADEAAYGYSESSADYWAERK